MASAHPEQVRGEQLGLMFPVSIEALLKAGPQFLTTAFQACGSLAPDNRVTAITHSQEFFGGGAGRKLWLSLAYEHDTPGLHRDLFVKFPLDFGNPLRELFSHLMAPETRFALLSRQPGFPVVVPRCYFADYDPLTRSGILITERIAFGKDGIEPFHDKCLDDEIDDALPHYRVLLRTLARLAGAHRRGQFGIQLAQQFPHDPTQLRSDDLIPYTAAQLREKLDRLRDFAARHPGLLPAAVREETFLRRFGDEALRFLEHEQPIKRYLNSRADCIALCHWNANIDNAWFWRNEQGELEAGLLDWGSVGQMNVAQSIFGALCAVETDFWEQHLDELLQVFIDEYAASGGPRLLLDDLRQQVQFYAALLGLAWMIDAPSIITSQLPDLDLIADRHDPRLRGHFLARAQLQLLTVMLDAWRVGDFGQGLDDFLRRDQPAATA